MIVSLMETIVFNLKLPSKSYFYRAVEPLHQQVKPLALIPVNATLEHNKHVLNCFAKFLLLELNKKSWVKSDLY